MPAQPYQSSSMHLPALFRSNQNSNSFLDNLLQVLDNNWLTLNKTSQYQTVVSAIREDLATLITDFYTKNMKKLAI